MKRDATKERDRWNFVNVFLIKDIDIVHKLDMKHDQFASSSNF